jgi:WD40 repeat protein
VTTPAVSPDGRRIASVCGSPDKLSLKLFDLAAGKECFSQPGRPWDSGPYAPSPDWDRVAYDGKLLDTTTGKEVATLKAEGQPLTDLVFAPDGKSLFGSGEDGRLVRWSAADGSVLKEWRLGGYIQRIALTADGRHLFVSNQNGTVYVLRLAPAARGGK